MEMEMLRAAQDAAVAGQSAARAAWWGLALNALTALGAVGALWYAIIQGGRAARFERMQAAMQITRILELIGPISDQSAHDEAGFLDTEQLEWMVDQGILNRAVVAIAEVSVDRVPDVGAASYLEVLRMTLPAYERRLKDVPLLFMRYDEHARTICEAHRYFTLLREVVLRNSFRARAAMRREF